MDNLFLGDCLETLKQIPSNSIDMILTSPPYKIGKEYDESICLKEFIDSSINKLKDNGVFAWQVGNRVVDGFIEPIEIETHSAFKKHGFKLINRVIWTFGHGHHCKARLSPRYETICLYSKNKNHIFNLDEIRVPQKFPGKKYYRGPKKGQLSGNPLGKNPGDVWDIPNIKNNHPEKTNHPCQFPELLCEKLISAFSNPGDIVLDPFMGSGTSGVVSHRLNRKFIGIEKDLKYFEIAQQRIVLNG